MKKLLLGGIALGAVLALSGVANAQIKLGVGEEDDIDGLCGIDPEATGSDAGVAVGTPRPGRFAAFYGTQPE